MNITFINSCNHSIALKIDDTVSVCLQPRETTSVTRQDAETMKLTACRTSESVKIKSVYHLVIETEYVFFNVSANDTFYITREKIQFSPNASYDRLFVQPSIAATEKISENHRISAEEQMKRIFAKEMRGDFIFDTFLFSSTLIIFLTGIGIRLTSLFGWKVALVYFPLEILFVVALNLLIDKLWRGVSKKVFKVDDDKTEFYRYFENEFITDYYSNADRTPYMGHIETD